LDRAPVTVNIGIRSSAPHCIACLNKRCPTTLKRLIAFAPVSWLYCKDRRVRPQQAWPKSRVCRFFCNFHLLTVGSISRRRFELLFPVVDTRLMRHGTFVTSLNLFWELSGTLGGSDGHIPCRDCIPPGVQDATPRVRCVACLRMEGSGVLLENDCHLPSQMPIPVAGTLVVPRTACGQTPWGPAGVKRVGGSVEVRGSSCGRTPR